MTRKVLSKKKLVVLPGITVRVDTTCAPLLSSRNYTMDACFAGVHDALTDHGNYVTYTNTTSKPQTIPRRQDSAQFGIWKRKVATLSHLAILPRIQQNQARFRPPCLRLRKELGLPSLARYPRKCFIMKYIFVHKNLELADCLEALVVEFQNCWEDDGTPIDILEEERNTSASYRGLAKQEDQVQNISCRSSGQTSYRRGIRQLARLEQDVLPERRAIPFG